MDQDQESIPKIDARITFPEVGVRLNCRIRQVSDDIYRVCEHPTFAEDQMKFDDLVRIQRTDDQNYEFQEVTLKSPLTFVQYNVDEEVMLAIGKVLDKTIRSNGYWQRDFGGILTLYYDAELFDPRLDLEILFKEFNENQQP